MMTQGEISWIVVMAIIALVGLIISILTPLLKLNTSITKLNAAIDRLNSDNELRAKEVASVNAVVETHGKYLMIDKQRLDNHEARLHKLDKQEGLKDGTDRK